jgi:hypothetical protein
MSALPIFGMQPFEKRALIRNGRLGREAKQRLAARIPLQISSSRIVVPDADASRFKRKAKPIIVCVSGFAQGVLPARQTSVAAQSSERADPDSLAGDTRLLRVI